MSDLPPLRHWISITAAAALFLLQAATLPAQVTEEPVTATDLTRIEEIGSITVGPDDRQAAYTVRRIVSDSSDADYDYRTDIYRLVLGSGGPPQQLTRDPTGASDPDWHPDGDRLAFVRPVDDTPQIFILPLYGGESQQLTDFKYGATDPRWSPDGSRILFTSTLSTTAMRTDSVYGTAGSPVWPHERPGREDIAAAPDGRPDPNGSLEQIRAWLDKRAAGNNPAVTHRLNFLGERALDSEVSFDHLFVVDAETGAHPKRVTQGYFSYGGGDWTPDGERIVFHGAVDSTRHPDRVRDSDLFIAGADGSSFERLAAMEDFALSRPKVSPRGDLVAFQAYNEDDFGYAQTRLAVRSIGDTGRVHILTDSLDRAVRDPAWSANGWYLYFRAASNGGFPLYRVSSRTDSSDTLQAPGHVERLTDYSTGIRTFHVHEKGIVFAATDVSNPYELYASRLDGDDIERISSHNESWLDAKAISFPRKDSVVQDDTTTIDYWVMRPTFYQAGETYPLMVAVHGGPSAMWGPGEATMWHEFQYFAARGYGIVYTNPRGSSGYGRDFQRANHQSWGPIPRQDVLDVVSEVSRLSWVDTTRQVITGGSYGGYLAADIVANDQRFEAAAAQRGVYDLDTFFGEGNAWRLVPDRFGGYPWEETIGPILEQNSPTERVDRIRTPLLIMHASEDNRTGVAQSEMLYRSLKVLDRPVEYVRYPNAGHDLSRTGNPTQRIDRILRMYEFFSRYMD